MQAGVHVVDGVIPVVHAPPIQHRGCKVTGKVVLGVHVASIVLQHVECDDRVLGPHLRQPDRRHEPVRVGVQAVREEGIRHRKFQPRLFVHGTTFRSLCFQIHQIVVHRPLTDGGCK